MFDEGERVRCRGIKGHERKPWIVVVLCFCCFYFYYLFLYFGFVIVDVDSCLF